MPKQVTLTKQQITELAEAHIRHFKNLLEGRTMFSINPQGCEEYLAIWKGVLQSAYMDTPISAKGETELNEAVMSGDYDYIVPIDEDVQSIQLP